MDLSSDDKQNMQLDFNYISSPIVNDRLSARFHLPTAMEIAYKPDFVMHWNDWMDGHFIWSLKKSYF